MTATKRMAILSSCLVAIGLLIALIALAKAQARALGDQGTLSPVKAAGGTPTVLTDTVSITLTPGVAKSLVYTDSQGLPTLLGFPAQAVVQTTTLTFVPELMTAPRPGFISGGHLFYLIASRDDMLDKSFKFNAAVTVTVHYSDDDVQRVADESLFSLYWWSGNDWQNAARTCYPVSQYAHDEPNNVINTAICYPGQFGLFATYPVYLPLVARAVP